MEHAKETTRELWLAATIEANGLGQVLDIELNRMGHATFVIVLDDKVIEGFTDIEDRYWNGNILVVPSKLQARVKELQTKLKHLKGLRQS